MKNYILLIDCLDEKGLIYRITKILYEFGLNIISNNEFVEQKTNHFFMRIRIYWKYQWWNNSYRNEKDIAKRNQLKIDKKS